MLLRLMFSGSEAKVKQPLRCISLICSYMRTFPIKVHYKVIEILAVRWLGTKLMQIFKETTLQAAKASWAVSWERRRSQYNICFPHKLNIVLEGW